MYVDICIKKVSKYIVGVLNLENFSESVLFGIIGEGSFAR